mgnify:CR=1 FL=1
MRRPFLIVSLMSTLVFACIAPAHAGGPSPSRTQPVLGSAATLERWAAAFRARQPQAMIAELTQDYRGHAPGEAIDRFDEGIARETERTRAEHLLLGIVQNGRTVLSGADSVGVTLDGVREWPDPEHADSTEHYRLTIVTRLGTTVRRADGSVLRREPSAHVFQMVRGDAARLDSTQSASPDAWYVRGTFEDLPAIRRMLATVEGECPSEVPVRTAPGSPTVLAVRPLAGPACPGVSVVCEFVSRSTARVQLYDVSGRLVNERTVNDPQPGAQSVMAGAGALVPPGTYWVRLVQGDRPAAVRRVLVGR